MSNIEKTNTLLDLIGWPHDKFSLTTSVMGKVRLGDFDYVVADESRQVVRDIGCEEEISIEIPGIAGLEFVIGTSNGSSEFKAGIVLGEELTLVIEDLHVIIRFSNSLFQPVELIAGRFEPVPNAHAEIALTTSVTIDSNGEIEASGLDAFTLPPMMIGDTGIVIEADEVALILSSAQAVAVDPEQDPNWRGITISSAKIHLPFDVGIQPEQFQLDDLKIGSGGLSGTIRYQGTASGSLFGFDFTLTQCEISFVQNVITDSAIQGSIHLPFFDVDLTVDIGLTLDGDFTVSLSNADTEGLVEVTKAGIVTLKIASVEFEKKDETFLIRLSGSLKLLGDFAGLDEIEIQSMTIDSDGNISIDGGWLSIPSQLSFDFHGFSVEITKIGFGYDDDWRWIGLSGGIQLVEGLSLGGSIEGLRIKWKSSGQTDVEFSGIGVNFTIPNVLAFDGAVAYEEEGNSHLFRGGIKLELYPVNVACNAQLIVGEHQGHTVLFIMIEGELPVGIPLFSTGLALYGMAGLYGQHVKPGKTPVESWLDWGKKPGGPRDQDNWTPEGAAGQLAFGAGCMIGTLSDTGYSFNANLLLVLLLPGPVILLEGKADFLSTMGDVSKDDALTTESTFYTLAVLDCRAGNFLFNIDAGYKLPDSGWILDIHGSTEAFFDFFNFYNWHLYLGQFEPTDKRLRATFINIFEANSYFMLGKYYLEQEGFGIASGAKLGYDRRWKFGPIRVTLAAWIEGNGHISFKPPQLGGDLWLEGSFDISVFGLGLGFSIGAGIAANTPSPYYIRAELEIKINLPWPLPDPKVHVVLEWKEDRTPHFESPLEGVSIEHLKVSEKLPLQHYPSDSNEASILAGLGNTLVPLDARPTVIFSKTVKDVQKIGVNAINPMIEPDEKPLHPELVPPQKPEHGTQYEVRYELVALNVYYKSNATGKWKRAAKERSIYGTWLADGALITRAPKVVGSADSEAVRRLVPEAITPSMTKLMLWSRSPFDYYREQVASQYGESRLQTYPKPCEYKDPPDYYTMDFEDLHEGDAYQALFRDNLILIHYEHPLSILKKNHWQTWASVAHGLELPSGGSQLNILFQNKSAVDIELYVGQRDVQSTVMVEPPAGVFTVQACYHGETVWMRENVIIAQEPLSINIEGETGKVSWITISGQNAALLKMRYRLADEIEAREEYNEWVSDRMDRIEEAWSGSDFLLEPYQFYKMKIQTKIHYREKGDHDWKEITPLYTHYAYFRTGGPPGFETNIDFKELNDLNHYVRRTIPRVDFQTPRPHYRAYDVGVEFDEAYVEKMYAMADKPLAIRLYDNNDNPLSLRLRNEWSDGVQSSHTLSERFWEKVIEQCMVPEEREKMKIISLVNYFVLHPQTLYTARLLSDGRPVYAFRFITSRFSTFAHQIHSFLDAVWDHHVLSGEPETPLLGNSECEALGNVTSEVKNGDMHESDAYRVIHHEILNMGYRPLPARVELTLIRDVNWGRGFFLESPEPIDWRRIALTVFRTNQTLVNVPLMQPATSPVKIIDACLDPSLTDLDGMSYDVQWVDILTQEDLDPSDYLIEHAGVKADMTDNLFYQYKRYFQFGKEKTWPAGTIFRIHAGGETSNAPLPPEPERIHRYIEGDPAPQEFQLNTSGDSVRILDGTGGKLHERSFIPRSDFIGLAHPIIMQDNDQTRAFIFFLSQTSTLGEFPVEGRMRFHFKFYRNINATEKDDFIVLKRAGSETPESATIAFDLPPLFT